MLVADSCDPMETTTGAAWCDARGAQESWDVVDPHPGPLIRASLEPHLPQLEYRELAECGHYPWIERSAREEFLATLRAWLSRQFAE